MGLDPMPPNGNVECEDIKTLLRARPMTFYMHVGRRGDPDMNAHNSDKNAADAVNDQDRRTL